MLKFEIVGVYGSDPGFYNGLTKVGYSMVLPTYSRVSPVAPDDQAKATRINEMLEMGAKGSASQAELISQVEVFLISIPTSRVVEGLMYAPDGIIANIATSV